MTVRPNTRDRSRDYATVEMCRLVREVQRQALEHLAHQYHAFDGVSAVTFGSGDLSHRGASEFTTLERHALARAELVATVEQIKDDMDALPIMLASYLAFARKAQGYRAPTAEDAPHCTSNGRDGYMEWMDPLCQDLATKSGLCHRCYMREYRWRKAHGLTPRDVQEGVGLVQ